MMAVHELGHVLGAWATGGTVARVVLHPLTISRTDLAVDPRPLLVVWAGPIIGVLLPLAALGLFVVAKWPGAYLTRFFAGFCLIANGAYIGVGSFDAIGDAGDMFHYGSPAWLLWLFGVATTPLGLFLWHGLGQKFGIGKNAEEVDRGTACICVMLLIVVVTLELALSPR
jgi:hypothetical protein